MFFERHNEGRNMHELSSKMYVKMAMVQLHCIVIKLYKSEMVNLL